MAMRFAWVATVLALTAAVCSGQGIITTVAGSATSFGTLYLQGTTEAKFAANLVKGGQIDLGSFSANLGVAKNIAVE